MAEGKTSMFGKTYNTIGSTDSNFIIKTKGDLKVQWGNKYIDVIKNGKIASESDKILKKVDTIENITSDGIYLVGDIVWVIIDGVKIQLSSSNQEDIFVSYLTEQKDITSDQKNIALTNIGFYYNTLEDAKSADIKAGLIYVKGDSKLYIIKDGIFSEYTINQQQSSEKIEESNFEKLYIEEYSLVVDGEKYATLENNCVNIHKRIIVEDGIYSKDATTTFGYKLYMFNGESYLEVDHVIQRKDTLLLTHQELLSFIKNKTLVPKKYYIIEDFQNPWEVSWGNEPIYYENQYTEINGVQHLSGIRNAMHLIVQAANYDTLEEQVWSLENPKWYIKYDVLYLGPEHKISDDNIQYGFRNTTDDAGNPVYLPCKGRIFYLKDELGNEGNFNFRQIMFNNNNVWRYCIDNTQGGLFGTFEEKSSKNKFFIDYLHIDTQVFEFTEIKNSNIITGYDIKYKDDNVLISYGYKIRLRSDNIISNNEFIISNYYLEEDSTIIDITAVQDLSENIFIEVCNPIHINNNKLIKNTFSNIYYKYENIDINHNMEGNILENIPGKVLIKGEMLNNTLRNLKQGLVVNIKCEGNIINKFLEENDLSINGSQFNNNIIEILQCNINNSSIFNNNRINQCLGEINNSGIIKNNTINIIKNGTYFTNSKVGQINNNIITNINSDILNSGTIEDNSIDTIEVYFSNSKEITNNQIGLINDFSNQMIMQNNSISEINQVYGGNGTMKDNTIILFKESEVTKNMHDNIIDEIITSYIYKDFNNNSIKLCKDTTFEGSGDITYNDMNVINNTYISDSFNNNKIKGYIQDSYFNKKVEENIVVDNIIECDLQEFIKNRIYDSFEKVSATKEIKNCVFNNSIKDLTCSLLNNCYFDEINTLDLYDDVYYTSFHGYIGNPLQREFTEDDWILLKDKNKKKDVYPNIKVVCVPELYIPGMIIMWHGSIDTIPEGWYLCDGNNGTPDLIGKFIKAGEEEGDNEVDDYLQEDNMLTLDKSHLPKHSHPHDIHTHTVSINTYEGTTYSEQVEVTSDSKYLQDVSGDSTDFITSVDGDGVENTSTSQGLYKIDQSGDYVYSSSSSGHTHNFSITLENPEVSEEESKEIGDWEDPIAIKIEPAAYSLIFIMRGYNN